MNQLIASLYLFLFLLVSIFSVNVENSGECRSLASGDSKSCESYLELLKKYDPDKLSGEIKYFLEKSKEEIEHQEYIKPKMAFDKLKTMKSDIGELEIKSFLYIVSTEGKLYFAPRFILEDEKILVKHTTIYNTLKEKYPNIKIAAAGEFKIANGYTTSVTNKSGHFRGGEDHLNYAKLILEKNKFSFSEDTSIIDISKKGDLYSSDDGHVDEYKAAKLLTLVRRDENYIKYFKKYMKLYREMYKFKSEGDVQPPSHLDINKMADINLNLQTGESIKLTNKEYLSLYLYILYFTTETTSEMNPEIAFLRLNTAINKLNMANTLGKDYERLSFAEPIEKFETTFFPHKLEVGLKHFERIFELYKQD